VGSSVCKADQTNIQARAVRALTLATNQEGQIDQPRLEALTEYISLIDTVPDTCSSVGVSSTNNEFSNVGDQGLASTGKEEAPISHERTKARPNDSPKRVPKVSNQSKRKVTVKRKGEYPPHAPRTSGTVLDRKIEYGKQLASKNPQAEKARTQSKRQSKKSKRHARKTQRTINNGVLNPSKKSRSPSPKLKTTSPPESLPSIEESDGSEGEEQEPTDEDDDYDFEGTHFNDVVPETFQAKLEGFEYYEPMTFLWSRFPHYLFGWVFVRRDALPRSVISALNTSLNPRSHQINADLTRTAVFRRSHIERWLAAQNQLQRKTTEISTYRYIYAFYRQPFIHIEKVADAMQLVSNKQEQVKINLKNAAPFPWTWQRLVYTLGYTAMYIGGAYLTYHYWKVYGLPTVDVAPAFRWVNAALEARRRLVRERRETPMSVLFWAPVSSAYIEETLKIIPGMSHVIGVLDAMVWRDWKKYRWHVKSMRYGYFERLRAHLAHNTRSFTSPLFNAYCNKVKGLDDAFEYGIEELAPGDTLPSQEYPTVPDLQNPHRTYAHHIPPCLRMDLGKPGWYPLCWFVCNMQKPANTWHNFQAAVLMRLCSQSNGRVQKTLLKELQALNNEIIMSTNAQEMPTTDQWIGSLRSDQRVRVEQVIQDWEEGIQVTDDTTTFLKSNEFLCAEVADRLVQPEFMETFDAGKKFIPRLICNVATAHFARLGLFSKFFQDEFKKLFSNNNIVFKRNERTIAPYFACGALSSDLDEWFERATGQTETISFAVLGDDTLAVDPQRSEGMFIETDFSKFDRTQSEALVDLTASLIAKCGYQCFSEMYSEMYRSPIKYNFQDNTGKFTVPVRNNMFFRLTGEPFTCLGNSHVNIVVSTVALAYDDAAVYERAGLKVKRSFSNQPAQVTFLKGVFLKASHLSGKERYCWTRLPSFLCKFGKMLCNPMTLFTRTWSPARRYQQMLWAQWRGFGELKNNWFYTKIHEIIKTITPLAKRSGEFYNSSRKYFKSKLEVDDYKVVSDSQGYYISDEEFDAFMLDRYSITRMEMEDFLDLFSMIKILHTPILIYHPMVTKLMLRDYG
jgi:hypothetical protein